MATPDPPTVVDWGNVTEAELRSIAEFLGGYMNRAGIPDTKEGLRTRANASWPRFMTEFVVCANEIWAGRKQVPQNTGGQAPGAGKLWRQGDDEAWAINFFDFTLYSLPVPQVLWPFNARSESEFGAEVIGVDSSDSRYLWEAMNVRGGVSGDLSEDRRIYGLRSTSNNHYWSSARVSNMEQPGELTVAGFFTLPQWNQANDGCVLLSHRLYNSADETGVVDRLGFELALGDPTGTNPENLALYYRDRDGADVERTAVCEIGGGGDRGPVYLPWGREHFIAIRRVFSDFTQTWHVSFMINGITIDDTDLGPQAEPGTSPDMRVLFGAAWDGLKHLGGGIRNVAIWTPAQTQPTEAQLQTYYRVGAGFLPRATFPT